MEGILPLHSPSFDSCGGLSVRWEGQEGSREGSISSFRLCRTALKTVFFCSCNEPHPRKVTWDDDAIRKTAMNDVSRVALKIQSRFVVSSSSNRRREMNIIEYCIIYIHGSSPTHVAFVSVIFSACALVSIWVWSIYTYNTTSKYVPECLDEEFYSVTFSAFCIHDLVG